MTRSKYKLTICVLLMAMGFSSGVFIRAAVAAPRAALLTATPITPVVTTPVLDPFQPAALLASPAVASPTVSVASPSLSLSISSIRVPYRPALRSPYKPSL